MHTSTGGAGEMKLKPVKDNYRLLDKVNDNAEDEMTSCIPPRGAGEMKLKPVKDNYRLLDKVHDNAEDEMTSCIPPRGAGEMKLKPVKDIYQLLGKHDKSCGQFGYLVGKGTKQLIS